MLTIWKYDIPITDRFTLEMPAKAMVLSVQIQYGTPCMWALVSPGENKETRRFILLGTGQPINVFIGSFIGTFQMRGGSLVFHLFEENK